MLSHFTNIIRFTFATSSSVDRLYFRYPREYNVSTSLLRVPFLFCVCPISDTCLSPRMCVFIEPDDDERSMCVFDREVHSSYIVFVVAIVIVVMVVGKIANTEQDCAVLWDGYQQFISFTCERIRCRCTHIDSCRCKTRGKWLEWTNKP